MNKPLKVVFVGDSKSGKTRACQKLIGFGNHQPYTATDGVQNYRYVTRSGTMIDIWDCGGDLRGLGDCYYINADICVVFGQNQAPWVRNVQRINETAVIYPFHSMRDLAYFFDAIDSTAPIDKQVTDQNMTGVF